MYKLKTILSLCAITVFGFFASSCLDEDGNLTYKIRVDAKDFLVEEPPLKTLVGTEWKLVAFVDVENNTSRPPIYGPFTYLDMYTIYFNDILNDTTFFMGNADVNGFWGLAV